MERILFKLKITYLKKGMRVYMKYFKKIIGDRIYLSPRNNEDVEKFTEWLNDFETTDYIGKSGILTTLQQVL